MSFLGIPNHGFAGLCVTDGAKFESRHEIDGLAGLSPTASVQNLRDTEGTLRVAGIAKTDFVARPEPLYEAG